MLLSIHIEAPYEMFPPRASLSWRVNCGARSTGARRPCSRFSVFLDNINEKVKDLRRLITTYSPERG